MEQEGFACEWYTHHTKASVLAVVVCQRLRTVPSIKRAFKVKSDRLSLVY